MKNTNLLIGKIGSGKTNTLFKEVENLINSNENLLIIDSKEEYFKTYSQKLNDNGYNTYVINLKNPKNSNGFNPLLLPYKLYKDGNKDEANLIVSEFAKELFKSESIIDPFWTNMATDYFVGLVNLLFKNGKEEEINLGSIYMMVSEIETKYISEFKSYLEEQEITSIEYISLSGTIFSAPETRSGIVSVLKSEINKYISYGSLLNTLSSNELDLTKLEDKFAIIIINNENYSRITNIIIDEISRVGLKVNYILDNIDDLTSINSLNNILENAKLRNEKVYITIRNVERLYSCYNKFITDKIENIIEVNNIDQLVLGNYSSYPKINDGNNKYFKIESILK